MIQYKTKAEIELVRESCLLVSETLAYVASFLKAGMTTLEVDSRAEAFILEHNAQPSFKNYKGFPFACCISVNDAIVHGFPNGDPLKEGDIVTVDTGALKNGFHGDSAYTFAIGNVSAENKQLLTVTKASLYKGVENAVAGNLSALTKLFSARLLYDSLPNMFWSLVTMLPEIEISVCF